MSVVTFRRYRRKPSRRNRYPPICLGFDVLIDGVMLPGVRTAVASMDVNKTQLLTLEVEVDQVLIEYIDAAPTKPAKGRKRTK